MTGMGTNFSYPFYSVASARYSEKKGHRIINSRLNSVSGIQALRDKTIDFAVTDAFISERELAGFDGELISVPICLGAVALAFNIPGIKKLNLTAQLLSDIFFGKISYWDDEAIRRMNPGISLPHLKIVAVHRADGSGSTYILSDYLARVNSEWDKRMGKDRLLSWKSGVAVSGNFILCETIRTTPGSIGYTSLEYASMTGLPMASIQNRAGNFVEPGRESIRSAVRNVIYPDDMRLMLTDTAEPEAYPLCSFSWFLVYKNQAYAKQTRERFEIIREFLHYMTDPEQQKLAEKMTYLSLPPELIAVAKRQIDSMDWRGDGQGGGKW